MSDKAKTPEVPLTAEERAEFEALKKERDAELHERAKRRVANAATHFAKNGAFPVREHKAVERGEDEAPRAWIDRVFAKISDEHMQGSKLEEDDKVFLAELGERRYKQGDRRLDALTVNRVAQIAAKLDMLPGHVAKS